MKIAHWMIAVAGIAFVLPAQAQAAVGDPELILYRFPGVIDNGGAGGSGVATVFHCTNFSGVTEAIRIVVRNFDNTIQANVNFSSVAHLRTLSAGTHATVLYVGQNTLGTGAVNHGTAAIAATSTSIVCTAMTIDAASASPVGIALHGIRFNPAPGSQE